MSNGQPEDGQFSLELNELEVVPEDKPKRKARIFRKKAAAEPAAEADEFVPDSSQLDFLSDLNLPEEPKKKVVFSKPSFIPQVEIPEPETASESDEPQEEVEETVEVSAEDAEKVSSKAAEVEGSEEAPAEEAETQALDDAPAEVAPEVEAEDASVESAEEAGAEPSSTPSNKDEVEGSEEPEPVPEPEVQAEVESESPAEPVEGTEPVSEAEGETAPEAEAEAEPEPEPETNGEAGADDKAKADAETEPKDDTESEEQPEAEPEPEPIDPEKALDDEVLNLLKDCPTWNETIGVPEPEPEPEPEPKNDESDLPEVPLDEDGNPIVEPLGVLTSAVETPFPPEEPKVSKLEVIKSAAAKGASSVKGGYSALRQVNQAKQAHAKAKEALAGLQDNVNDLNDKLGYRQDVENSYESILAEQNANLESASSTHKEATELLDSLNAQHAQATNQLNALKADNEQRLSPYYELMSQAKDVLDEAEHQYHDVHRNLKVAQNQANDALSARDSRLNSADHAVESAAARLAELQDTLAAMKKDPTTGTRELQDMNGAVAQALAQLEKSREENAQITQDTAQAVESTQANLANIQQIHAEVEADLKAAREDERTKRDQYIKLRREADDDEHVIQTKIDELGHSITQATQTQQQAQDQIADAQSLIAEAQDIHDHPEITEQLAKDAAQAQQDLDAKQAEIAELAEQEKSLRESTQQMRTSFFAVCAAAVVLLIVIIYLLVPKG